MAKMTADEFFSTKSTGNSNKTPSTLQKMSADDFFNTPTKEFESLEQKWISDGSKEILNNTLSSVTQKAPAKPEPYAVDFKAAQKKQVAQNQTDQKATPSIRLTPVEPVPTIESKMLGTQQKETVSPAFQGNIPAAQFLQPSGGPSNASQIPGVSQYETTKSEIANSKAPAIVKSYADLMNYITQGNPLGEAVSRSFAGNSGATRRDSTGNAVVDKVTDVINDFVTPILTPTGAPVGQGIIGSTYGATEKILANEAGNKAVNYAANSLINKGLIPGASRVIADRVARVGITEGIAGSAQGAGFYTQQQDGSQSGKDFANSLIDNAKLGAVGGAVLGGAGAVVGEGVSSLLNRFRKSGLSETEIAEIAPDLLALPEANPRTVRKQTAGEIKTQSSQDPISTPYTFKLGEATDATKRQTNNAIEGRTEIRNIDNQINSLQASYEQRVIDEYKTLKAHRDKPSGVKQGNMTFDDSGNVTAKFGRSSNNPVWYQEAMRENNYRRLTNKQLYELAQKHVDEGFNTEVGRVPSWKQENGFDEQMNALRQARQTMESSIREIDPAINVTDSPLKTSRLNGESSQSNPSIRSTELSREQKLVNKVNAGETLTPEEVQFALSSEWDNSKVFPEETPTKSTYVKPRPKETPVEVKTDVTTAKHTAKKTLKEAATIVKKEPATVRKEQTPGIRANYKTMADSGNISSSLKAGINKLDQKYDIARNVDSVAKANENIKNLSKAENDFLMNQSGGADHIATGYRVMQELDRIGEHARSLAIADKLAKDLTKAGQTGQAGRIIQSLSPEGQLLDFVRKAEKNGKVVTVEDSVKFKNLAAEKQTAAQAPKDENAINDILDRIKPGQTVTEDDVKAITELLKKAESKVTAKPVKDKLPKELNDARKRDKVISFLEAQEAAAQARINKRRGRLNSMPVDEWIDYSILIAAKVGKGIINAETYVEDLVKLFGEDIKPLAAQIFNKAQDLVGGVTKSTLEGDFIKASDSFKRITGKEGMSQQERIAEKYIMENPKVTAEDIANVRKLAKSMTDLAGDDRIKADIAMQKILNSYEKSSPWNKVQALRYMSMLLNDATQSINAISGPLMATYFSTVNVLHTMIDVAMHATLKTPRNATMYGTNPLRFIAEYYKGAKLGGRAGWEGANPAGIQNVHEIRGLAFKSLKNPFSIAERTLGAVAKGADFAAYSAVYKSELRKIGYLEAINSGIKKSDKGAIESFVNKFVNDPPIEAIERADKQGKKITFQRSDSLGGKTANWLNSAPPAVKPAVTAVVPFVRTPLNIASTAVSASPGGIVKGLFQLSSLSKASQYDAIQTLSMGLTGTGMSAIGFYLSYLGIISGANDTGNKDVNSINDQAGRAKYRFNTSAMKRYLQAMINGEGADAAEKAAKYQQGDHAFDYNKLQPLAFPLAMGAGFQEAKGNTVNKLVSAGKQSYNSLFGMTSLKGVQDVFQPQYTGTQSDKSTNTVVRVLESYIKSFSPSALAQVARQTDPIVRKTTYGEGIKSDVLSYYQSRIPGVSKSLPPNKDTLGNNKLNAPGFAGQHLNPYKSEVANYSPAAALIADLIDRTGDQSIAPKPPAKYFTVDGEKITIPQKRYEQLQEDTGNAIKQRIMEIEGGTDAEMIEQINTIYSEVKEEMKDQIKEEMGL